MSTVDKNIKAFIYDMGGVVMRYVYKDMASAAQLPSTVFGKQLELLETGKISVEEFLEENSENDCLKEVIKKYGNIFQKSDFYEKILEKDENIEKSLKVLRKNGYKIVLLTNNFFLDKNKLKPTISCDKTLFDIIVESCRVGMFKPNRDIFEYTLSLLNLQPSEAVFLDDLEINCNGAKNVGLKTIQVKTNKSEDAVKEIEQLTGLSIL
ncbi:Bifunctional epoxide hydrolase 2 [Strongyloides ratti]|uniref:Bifunctional epoxide hydrolase 2 n=1 Tax=Strongyloides ratti TaxID=34506 RepID=A0A090N0E8_STRRB|nr:Bifunctional epoxide hydrolase 2 [Strongyloides ratti]CEF70562.1 Bifunctional epoxide hydrolase 2 [Strongyloides ratti]